MNAVVFQRMQVKCGLRGLALLFWAILGHFGLSLQVRGLNNCRVCRNGFENVSALQEMQVKCGLWGFALPFWAILGQAWLL